MFLISTPQCTAQCTGDYNVQCDINYSQTSLLL